MPADQLRDRYVGLLLDRLTEARYPSAPMLDRIESAISDREMAEAYVNSLLEHMEQERFPSPTMMDRMTRLLSRL
jgi:hypothetical protein